MTTIDTPRTDSASFSSRDPLELLQTSQQLERELAASKAEVERLRSQLERAVEIAEEFWDNQKQAVLVYHQELADELGQLKATMNHDKK